MGFQISAARAFASLARQTPPTPRQAAAHAQVPVGRCEFLVVVLCGETAAGWYSRLARPAVPTPTGAWAEPNPIFGTLIPTRLAHFDFCRSAHPR